MLVFTQGSAERATLGWMIESFQDSKCWVFAFPRHIHHKWHIPNHPVLNLGYGNNGVRPSACSSNRVTLHGHVSVFCGS